MSAHRQRAQLIYSVLLSALAISCGSPVNPGSPIKSVPSDAVVPTSEPALTSSSLAPAPEVPPPPRPPAPEVPPAPRPPSAPTPTSAPPRPGAPYDIAAIDVVGGPADAFWNSVDDRCGNTRGRKCLTIIVGQTVVDNDLVEGCLVDSISYDRPLGPPEIPEEEKKLQRGTKVTVVFRCPPDTTPPPDPARSGR